MIVFNIDQKTRAECCQLNNPSNLTANPWFSSIIECNKPQVNYACSNLPLMHFI